MVRVHLRGSAAGEGRAAAAPTAYSYSCSWKTENCSARKIVCETSKLAHFFPPGSPAVLQAVPSPEPCFHPGFDGDAWRAMAAGVISMNARLWANQPISEPEPENRGAVEQLTGRIWPNS